MENLNEFENEILRRLSQQYNFIKDHIPFLRIKSRVNTGVGMYVNFEYANNDTLAKMDIENGNLSTNENIVIPGLKNGLGYEVDIENGRLNFIELYTYGESWDGQVSTFHFL